jgi:pRiA4b ORF-3-like protein
MSRPSAAMPSYVFRVRILGGFYAPPGAPGIWREIELAGDQTLAELGASIPAAFGFEDDHLWSFFLSGKPWDRASEYERLPDPPAGGGKRGAGGLRVGDAPARKEFLFLFDYGDEWHFGVKLLRTGEVEPGARYPRVVASRGQAPPQYPDLDDEDDWDENRLAQFPPVELAPLPQLQAAAAAAPTVRRLRALVEWLGEGRKLTAAGNLTLADAKELARLLDLGDPTNWPAYACGAHRTSPAWRCWSTGPGSCGWPASTRAGSCRSSGTGACWTSHWSCSFRPPPSCP